mgnify:CR=1 FL=1
MASHPVTPRQAWAERVGHSRDGLYARLGPVAHGVGHGSNPGSASATVCDFGPGWPGDTQAGCRTADGKGCADPGRITRYSECRCADGSNGSLAPNQNRTKLKGRKSQTKEHAIKRRRKKIFCFEWRRKRLRKKTEFLTGGYNRVSE